MAAEHLNVLIIGAGLSGVGAAWHLQNQCPSKTFALLEARQAIGGTWDIHRYPGVRSDSEMYTYAYNFRPWTDSKVIADGATILKYIRDTASENGIDKKVRYGVKVVKADWSDDTATWTVTTERQVDGSPKQEQITCDFLLSCAGYYSYEKPNIPDFAGRDDFKGPVVHPQQWPDDLDYTGKTVVIIGSGATAVTLLPSMTDKAAHVTMLQRTPTYMANIPERDRISDTLRKVMPDMMVHRLGRARGVALQLGVFRLAKAQPKVLRGALLGMAKRQLGSKVDMKHFTPNYNPWDQRLCAVPNGDLFKAVRSGKASVVTDHIDRFTAKGIKLKSGQELEADIIITATGFNIQLIGGMTLSKNGKAVNLSKGMAYRGTLFEGIPNLGMIFGYTNSSWTLKSDISSEYICRLINYMDKHGYDRCAPVNTDPSVKPEYFVTEDSGAGSAGYIQRALEMMPKQGNKAPWRVYMNYLLDLPALRLSPLNDGVMKFSSLRKGNNAAGGRRAVA
ncbi:probable monooxygenase flavin-binding protein [gamma proteobacterium HdN1]|nr:probable monooxygenase flavin-binding protein [gamma proteobacterium HdN1]